MRRFLTLTLALTLPLAATCLAVFAADDDTAKAAETRKLLHKKISVNWKDTPLKDALEEIKDDVKGLFFLVDTAGGVSMNQKLTYSGKDVPVTEALDGAFKKLGLGYYVISQKGNARDGFVQIKKGEERGYPKDKGGDKDKK
jgi:hypothetical protein